jgi:MIP family channel proteins
MSDIIWKALLAEFIGTFTLVFISASALSLIPQNLDPMSSDEGGSLFGSALAYGLVLMSIIYVWGPYSGAHVNPAVSFGFAVSGQMNWGLMFGYWIAQVLGAICGAALVTYFFGSMSRGGNEPIGDLSYAYPWKAVLYEAFITFFLVIAYLFIYRNPLLAIISGLAIGLVLTFCMLSGGSALTGSVTNPAGAFGTAIFGGNLSNSWIYVVGPLLGALLAALVYKLFTVDMSCCNKLDECGNKVLDECGNQIKECKRPVLDSCGKVVSDCDGVKYETYCKIVKPLGYKQETFASTLGVDLSSRSAEPKHHMPDKLDSVLPCDIIDNPQSKECSKGNIVSTVMASQSHNNWNENSVKMTPMSSLMSSQNSIMSNMTGSMNGAMSNMNGAMGNMNNGMNNGVNSAMGNMNGAMGNMNNGINGSVGNMNSAMNGAMGNMNGAMGNMNSMFK